jgi:integrase
MATVNLTATRVDRLKYDPTGAKIQRTWDGQISGLGVEVFSTGRKSWIFRYRIHGKQRIITLGSTTDISLKDARETAIGYRALVREGIDPKNRRDAPIEGMTLDQLYESYTSTRYFKSKSESFQANLASTHRKYLQPELGHYPLQAIKRKQIIDMVDELIEEGKEGAARGLLNRTKILLSYAIGKSLIESSPADHIRPQYVTSGKRTAWLDSNEKLKEAWWFTGAPQARALIRWCLLTGCRRDEARTTQYSDFTDETWTVIDTKNGRDLILPMMPAMRQIVKEMRSTFGSTPFLFPATTTTRKAIPAGSIHYIVTKGARMDWSLHTLRHTVESYLRELEVAEETRDLILNHVRKSSGDQYSHGKALEMKRKGMGAWHKCLLGAVGASHADSSNVVQIRGAER